MSLNQIIVTLVILFLIVSLYKNLFGPGFTFIIGISILGIFRILTPEEMLKGFANEQLAVIILLLLIGEVIRKSTLIDNLFDRFFRRTFSYKKFIFKLIFPVSALSAFINNTPLVAIMMPYVHNWGKRNNIAPSKLLIPLSYAAILGGTASLIGTSTNLVVNGMVADQSLFPAFKSLDIFDFTPVGVVMILLGGLYLVFFSDKLLPDKGDVMDNIEEKSREYIVEMKVAKGSQYHNKTIEGARLRNLKGLFLVEIIREDRTLSPVTPQTMIFEEDLLIFAGNTETIADMVENNKTLQPSQLGMFAKRNKTELVEVVVSPNSGLIGKTVKESNFRGRFDAAIIAVHRNGEKIRGKIGDVKLSAGDLLLLIAGKDFEKRTQDSKDFYMLNNIRSIEKMPVRQSLLIVGGLLVSIVLSSLHWVPLFNSLLVFMVLLLLTKVASPRELYKAINYNLILIIALSLALGTAMIKTGIAAGVSNVFIELLKPYGIVTLFIGIFLITNLLAAIITNIASVAIIFPIAMSLAAQLGTNPKPFALLVAFAGAASFITPIGYQTNLMVYGPGGYNFKDFFRIGLPMTLLFMLVAVLGLVLQFGLKIN
ncbi:SLC13 family permease [Candidatus Sulfidibacterium hydrothermale]|uniref:SLC13 family permease n=1 Tax=Candidatus Sulfidibacterium hydrothermale TaxID=2875962 RepID=UPI0021D459F1|nr:SLC13 family permease [Candidatus Sulfidibacterium hydrothermale]UBM62470.1 SLC13 family permease [Candidatus Sulfidibacterium hydrothermale]